MIVVESLVDIVSRRLKKREAYEKRYGEGEFHRKGLAKYHGQFVSISGVVVGLTPKHVVLRQVRVRSEELDHLNVPVDIKHELRPIFEYSYKLGLRIKFKGAVHRYRRHGHYRFGVKSVISPSIVADGNGNKLPSGKAYGLQGINSYVNTVRGTGYKLNKGSYVWDLSDETNILGKHYFNDISTMEHVFANGLLSSLRKWVNTLDTVERDMDKVYGSNKAYLRSFEIDEVRKSRLSYLSPSEITKRLKKYEDSIEKSRMVYSYYTSYSHAFIKYWLGDSLDSTTSLSNQVDVLDPVNTYDRHLGSLYAIPVVFRHPKPPVGVSDEYLIILPCLRRFNSKHWRTSTVDDVLDLFGIDASLIGKDEGGVIVKIYNPLTNRVLVYDPSDYCD